MGDKNDCLAFGLNVPLAGALCRRVDGAPG
jgi:hypothetical protein